MSGEVGQAEVCEWLGRAGWGTQEIDAMSATDARDYLGGFTLLALARGDLDAMPSPALLPEFYGLVCIRATADAQGNGADPQTAVVDALGAEPNWPDRLDMHVRAAWHCYTRKMEPDAAQRLGAELRPFLEALEIVEATEARAGGSTWAALDRVIGPVAWAWENWLPEGMLTLIVGQSGEGKSQLLLRVMACALIGSCWPDGAPFKGELGEVAWCEAEAAQALNLDRAKKWELPLDKIRTPLANPILDIQLDNEQHRAAIEQQARRPDVRMIGVDSLRGAIGGDENAGEISGVVQWLARLARDTGKPVLLVHHLRKRGVLDVGDGINLDRIRGSSAIVQHARVVWAVDVPDPLTTDRKRLSCIKNNLARFPEPVGFEIHGIGLDFVDAPEVPRQETAQGQAADLLLSLLADGRMRSTAIKEHVEGAGLSWASAKKAKARMGIVSVREGQTWYWALSAHQPDRGI